MLIQCPNCQTTYKVSDGVLKGTTPAFRCSRCKHTFELEANDAPRELPQGTHLGEAAGGKSSADAEPSLPFAPKPEPANTDVKPVIFNQSSKQDSDDSQPKEENRHQWEVSTARREDERPFIMPESSRPGEQERMIDAPGDFSMDDPVFRKLDIHGESSNNILAISPYLEQRASILPYLSLLSLLVIGFSLLAVISHANPQTPENILKNIPLLGATVLKNNHLKNGILIKSLGTSVQSIQGNREVFLITGVALNQNPVVVREIQVTGKIYNRDGKEIEHQTIWVGNTISPKIIRGMTVEDIPQLQELKPLKSFEVPPGDSIPFAIVFLKSTKNANEFTCEVVNAQGEI
jgi:predicted Zn finger-like uncharacterized protein